MEEEIEDLLSEGSKLYFNYNIYDECMHAIGKPPSPPPQQSDKFPAQVPEDKFTTQVPEDKLPTQVPEDKPPTQMPEDKPPTQVPEDKFTTQVHEDEPPTQVPEDCDYEGSLCLHSVWSNWY